MLLLSIQNSKTCSTGLAIRWQAQKKLLLESGKIKTNALQGKIFAKTIACDNLEGRQNTTESVLLEEKVGKQKGRVSSCYWLHLARQQLAGLQEEMKRNRETAEMWNIGRLDKLMVLGPK